MRRLFPALAVALMFALLATLYATDTLAPYYRIIRLWGIKPAREPFLDTETVLSAVRCLRAGIDAYAVNPCDPVERVYDYSPLWMVLTLLPVSAAWLMWSGLAVALALIAALTLLPPARDREGAWLMLAGALSSTTVFALERGNNDLVIFVLAAGAAALLARSYRARAIAYGLILLAGLLKYYPLAAMMAALRERTPRLVALTLASLALTGLFVAVTWHDLSRALASIPSGAYFGDMFGAVALGGGLAVKLGLPHWFVTLTRTGLTTAALLCGIMLGRRDDTRAAVAGLTPRERDFLLVGALLVCGCFFTAQNIGYRAIHLLLVLPALTALRQGETAARLRALALVAVALLWVDFWRSLAPGYGLPEFDFVHPGRALFATWLVREALWWWLIVHLVALLVAALREGPGVVLVFGRHPAGRAASAPETTASAP